MKKGKKFYLDDVVYSAMQSLDVYDKNLFYEDRDVK